MIEDSGDAGGAGPGSCADASSPQAVSPLRAAIPIAKASVQKVGAVLRKAGFERARWLKSGQIKGWGNWERGYHVRLHWAGYIEVTFIEGSWARGTDEEREARHEAELQKMMAALWAAGLTVTRAKPSMGRHELRVPLAQGMEARSGETRSGSTGGDSPVGAADAPNPTAPKGESDV